MYTFCDAFKKNNAPFFIEDLPFGGEKKVYEQEAYTEDYMIKNPKTNKLCRYVILLDGVVVDSIYSFYGVKKSGKKAFQKVARKMTDEMAIQFIKNKFENATFKSGFEASSFAWSNRKRDNELEVFGLVREKELTNWITLLCKVFGY